MKGEKWTMLCVCGFTHIPSFVPPHSLFARLKRSVIHDDDEPFLLCFSASTRSFFLPSWLPRKKHKMRIHILTAFLLVINVAASHSSPLNSHARRSFDVVKRQLVSNLVNGALDGLGLGSESAPRCKNSVFLPCFQMAAAAAAAPRHPPIRLLHLQPATQVR